MTIFKSSKRVCMPTERKINKMTSVNPHNPSYIVSKLTYQHVLLSFFLYRPCRGSIVLAFCIRNLKSESKPARHPKSRSQCCVVASIQDKKHSISVTAFSHAFGGDGVDGLFVLLWVRAFNRWLS